MNPSSLLPFFNPKGVVVIGASTSPEKLGYGAARNLIQSGFAGAIHFVSQKRGELFGLPIYTNLQEVPDPVDLAILIVPPQATPETIEACGRRGVGAAVIVSSGFREVGEEGTALEQKCVDAARQYQVRLLGPNCIGTIDTHLPLDTTFLQPPMPTKGGIGFISHSGAFAASIVDWARGQGFGFSRIVSLGNQADINETDMLPMLADDPHTKAIVMYMEGVSDGRRFVKVASEVTKQKPVIALKVGRFEAGQKAAASHTGALAASDIAFDAAFEKAGILRADTAEQMFDWARALENCPLPRGKRIGILTNAGGPGVIAADSLETNGLALAKLSESTFQELSAILPPAASVQNPVDMLASASPAQYAECLKILLRDENVDGVMVILPPPPMFKAEDAAEKIVESISAQAVSKISHNGTGGEDAASSKGKSVIIALLGSALIENAEKVFWRAHIPTYPFPERAASAMSALFKRAQFLAVVPQDYEESIKSPGLRVSAANPNELLSAYGIPAAPTKLAHNMDEATVIAQELGFPVVMKIASPDILHKSDVGGVLLNVSDVFSLQSGYAQMIEQVKFAMPSARIEGIYIQRQIPQGQEVIVGMTRDPQFGPLIMFGSGGVEVEGLKDVAFALAPLNQAEVRKMMRKTWAGRRLKGFRHLPPADEEAVLDVLLKLSRLAVENENIAEIEINPLRVLERGAVALDIRMSLAGKD